MKYRKDFVTNSSSSSFICYFANQEEMKKAKESLLELYSESLVNGIFNDISRGKMTYTQAKELLQEVLEDELYWDLWPSYDNKNMSYYEIKADISKKAKKDRDIQKQMKNFEENCNHRGIFAEVNYSDDTGIGSMLEHQIMPSQSFVVKVINNH